jgi:branched-chain amino acid transport system ATP-binding protein
VAEILSVSGVTKRFGGLTAVAGVSFDVAPGEIFGVIGPNGAGKTTLFNVIAGYYRPTSGKIAFEGIDIGGRPSDAIARLGIARTFQSVYNFAQHSVRENLRRSEVIARRHDPLAYFTRRTHAPGADVEEVAAFIGLSGILDNTAGSLAYGQQKVLGIGMAMMVSPKLMLMDEPAAGLNSSEKKAMGQLIRRLRDERGISILIVEHDMPLVMGVCDRILVVNQGQPIAIGTPAEIKADARVIDAYLGEDYEFA